MSYSSVFVISKQPHKTPFYMFNIFRSVRSFNFRSIQTVLEISVPLQHFKACLESLSKSDFWPFFSFVGLFDNFKPCLTFLEFSLISGGVFCIFWNFCQLRATILDRVFTISLVLTWHFWIIFVNLKVKVIEQFHFH